MTYLGRKLELKCVYPGCDDPPGDTNLCEAHRREHNATEARRKRRARKARRRKRRCADCGRKSKAYRCVPCATRQDTAPTRSRVSVRASGDKRSARVARIKRHVDGRTRYHGQTRRGQPTTAQNDEWDLEKAQKAIADGRALLGKIEARRAAGLGRSEVKAARDEALALVYLGWRFLSDVLERSGWDLEADPLVDGE